MQTSFSVPCKNLRSPLKTVPRTVFLTLRSIPLYAVLHHKKRRLLASFLMVEMRGIEPLSEKSSSRLSTGVSRQLKFPASDAGAQASELSIFFIYGRFKRKPAAHIYHCVTPASRPWSSVKGRSRTQAARATLLLLAFIFKLRLL